MHNFSFSSIETTLSYLTPSAANWLTAKKYPRSPWTWGTKKEAAHWEPPEDWSDRGGKLRNIAVDFIHSGILKLVSRMTCFHHRRAGSNKQRMTCFPLIGFAGWQRMTCFPLYLETPVTEIAGILSQLVGKFGSRFCRPASTWSSQPLRIHTTRFCFDYCDSLKLTSSCKLF